MTAHDTQECHDGAETLATRALRVRVWIDFVCPYCFLAEGPLREATQGLNVILEWMPFELRPYPQPTLQPEGEYLQTVWRRSVYPLAEALGVPIRLPPVSPQPYSRLAFEGLQFAREHDKSDEYVDATLRAFFQEGLDIGQPEVLQGVARRVGLPDAAFAAALRQGRYTEAHTAALEQARETGIRAVPTLIVGEHLIEGMPGSDALRRAIDSAVCRYSVAQYGHLATPVSSGTRYTRGCEFHSVAPSGGQHSGKSSVDVSRSAVGADATLASTAPPTKQAFQCGPE